MSRWSRRRFDAARFAAPRQGPQPAPEPVIALNGNRVAEDASAGTLVGLLAVLNGAGAYAFTLTDDAGGLFALDGVDDARLEVAGALDFETAAAHQVTVEADNGVDAVLSRSLTIIVTDVEE